MPKASHRESILEAAEDVVIEQGAVHMTLDAVAAKAGVSKGGLLYHFPSKEALLSSMIGRVIAKCQAKKAPLLESLPKTPGVHLHACILCDAVRDERLDRVSTALIAAMANNPKLLEPVKELVHADVRQMLGSMKNFPSAAVLFLAAAGAKHLDLLGLYPFNAEQHQVIVAEMLKQLTALEKESAG